MGRVEQHSADHGATRQLPRYLQGEYSRHGYFLCIGFTDKDLDPKRVEALRSECDRTGRAWRVTIRLVVVDARRRASASRW
jgi:hypothetical protein